MMHSELIRMGNPITWRLQRQIRRETRDQRWKSDRLLWVLDPPLFCKLMPFAVCLVGFDFAQAGLLMLGILYLLTMLRSYALVQSDGLPGREDLLHTTSLTRPQIHLGYASTLLTRTAVDATVAVLVTLALAWQPVFHQFNDRTSAPNLALFIVTSTLFVAAASLWGSLSGRGPNGPRLAATGLAAALAAGLPLAPLAPLLSSPSYLWPGVVDGLLIPPLLLLTILWPLGAWRGLAPTRRHAAEWQRLPSWQRNVLVAFAWRRRRPLRDLANALLLGVLSVTPVSFLVVYLWCFTRGIKVRDTLGAFFKQCHLDVLPLEMKEIKQGYLLLTALPLAPALLVFIVMALCGWTLWPIFTLAADLAAFAFGVLHPLSTGNLMAAVEPQ
ncbi:MAG: hypothetical protein ACYCW6_22160 [Candidatus Xenobia bacterium]